MCLSETAAFEPQNREKRRNMLHKLNRKILFFILSCLLGICCISLSSCASNSTKDVEELVIATGGTAGTYFAVGGAMSTVLSPSLDDTSLSVLSTGGSLSNIHMLADKEAQLAIVQNDVMYYAYSGTDMFEKEGAFTKFSAIAGLYDETVQIVTCDPSIKRVEDLKGKTVSIGDSGSGVEFNAGQILSAYGLSFEDIKVVNASFADSAAALKNGSVQAAIFVASAPTKALTDWAAEKQISLISLDDEHIAALRDAYEFYTESTLPKDTYPGLGSDVKSVSVRATLVASNRVSEKQIYTLISRMFENKEQLADAHPGLASLDTATVLKGISIPLHPGAKKYYQEIGLNVD